MPSLRAVILAAVVGIGVASYFAVWFRWPTFVSVAIGATMAIVLLLFAASLAEDPEAADAAWRDAAPDLSARERAGDRSSVDAEPGDAGTGDAGRA